MKLKFKAVLSLLKRVVNPKNWGALYKEYRELANYIIFGVGTTIISFATYYLFRFIFPDENSVPGFLRWIFNITSAFGTDSNTALPVILSWVFAVTFAYITNRVWVFNSKAHTAWAITKEALGFYASRILTLGVDLVIMYLLVDMPNFLNEAFGGAVYEFCAKVLSNVVVLVLNYVLSKLFVFRSRTGKADENTKRNDPDVETTDENNAQ